MKQTLPNEIAIHRLALRELAAFCWRSGDLLADTGTGSNAREGTLAHSSLRARRPAGYRTEVPVRLECSGDGWRLTASGRLDGLYEDGGGLVVEEIKTLRGDPSGLPDTLVELHRAQLRLYAAVLAAGQALPGLTLELTWYDLDSETETRERQYCNAAELAAYLTATRERVAAWLQALTDHRRRRDRALSGLTFPHGEYRPGQRSLVAAAWRAMRDRHALLAEAPTGIGKTVSTLFPALRGLAAGFHDRVAWLTATREARLMPERLLGEVAAGGLPLFALSLTAREQSCIRLEDDAHRGSALPETFSLTASGATSDASTDTNRNKCRNCPLGQGFYQRLDTARHTALAAGTLDREGLRGLGESTACCPWGLGRELARWADVLVLDLNHAFAPDARLAFLLDDDPDRTTLLIDEAHHLAERVRTMHCETLDLSALREIAARHRRTATGRAAGRRARQATRLAKAAQDSPPVGDCRRLQPDAVLRDALNGFIEATGPTLDTSEDGRLRDQFFRVRHAASLGEDRNNSRQVLLTEARGSPRTLRFTCLDAAPLLSPVWPRLRAALLFSATLHPLENMRVRVGLPTDTQALELPSPFPPENLAVLTCSRIDTRLAARTASIPEITRLVLGFAGSRTGRYLVCFPSYRYLRDVLAAVEPSLPSACRVVAQLPGLDVNGRAAFLAPFRDPASPWVIGFAIAGGYFAEGVDFPGEELIGVMVVGTGLPAISAERECLREIIAAEGGDGWRSAYLLPGLARVLQTAGRLIRSASDRGVLVLVDRRYAHPELRSLLPAGWRLEAVRDAAQLGHRLADFWGSFPDD